MALDYNIIGQRIKKARQNKHLTQEDLAEKLDVSVAFLSRIERGSSHINLKRLNQICDILNITEGQILNGSSGNSKNYLNAEFSELLKSSSSEEQKLIYKIAQVIVNKDKLNLKINMKYIQKFIWQENCKILVFFIVIFLRLCYYYL